MLLGQSRAWDEHHRAIEKMNISQPTASQSVVRGQKIARKEKLAFLEWRNQESNRCPLRPRPLKYNVIDIRRMVGELVQLPALILSIKIDFITSRLTEMPTTRCWGILIYAVLAASHPIKAIFLADPQRY